MNNSSYIITACVCKSNGAILDITQRVKSLNILSDADEYVFPIIYLDSILTLDEYKAITNDKNKRIQLSVRQTVSSTIDASSYDTYKYAFKDVTFCVIDEYDTYIDKNTNAAYETSSGSDVSTITSRMVLMSEDNLNINKANMSGSFGDCNVQGLLMYLMNKLKTNKKTVMAKPDNLTMYPQILIPFGTALSTFKYIDTVYGVYKDGLKLFFDIDRNYILNKGKNNFEKSDICKSVILNVENSAVTGLARIRENTIDVISRNISYSNITNIQSEFIGTNTAFVMGNTNNTILKKDWSSETSTIDGFSEKQKVYYQKYSNPYIKNQLTPNNNLIVTVNIFNEDYDLIKFLNTYTINTNDTSNVLYGVEFVLNNYTHVFTRTRDNIFELKTNLVLKKI